MFVACTKCCRPYEEGGLNIRSLLSANEAFNLKLCWDMLTSDEDWEILLRGMVSKGKRPLKYHIEYSLWSSVKGEYKVVMYNTNYLVGNEKSIHFWLDSWCGSLLIQVLNLNPQDINTFP